MDTWQLRADWTHMGRNYLCGFVERGWRDCPYAEPVPHCPHLSWIYFPGISNPLQGISLRQCTGPILRLHGDLPCQVCSRWRNQLAGRTLGSLSLPWKGLWEVQEDAGAVRHAQRETEWSGFRVRGKFFPACQTSTSHPQWHQPGKMC